MKAIIRILKKIKNFLYDSLIKDRDMWQQLLNIAVLIAVFGSATSGIVSVVLGSSPIATVAFFVTAGFAVFCLFLSLKMKDIIYGALLFCILANFVLFPVMFSRRAGTTEACLFGCFLAL